LNKPIVDQHIEHASNCDVLHPLCQLLPLAVSLSGTVAGQGTGAAAIGGTATTGAAAAAAGVGNDWFNTIDANHDGSIDRQEYNQGMLKLDAIFKGPLAAAKAMMTTGDSRTTTTIAIVQSIRSLRRWRTDPSGRDSRRVWP
jgi:hypothetical protein